QRSEILQASRGVRFLARRYADGAAAVTAMAFNLTVQNTEFHFPCEPNEAVLDAAQRAGFEIPFSCRKGVCGTCKGRVVSVEVRACAGDALSAAERAEGQVLFCNSRPGSDLVIAPRSISR